MLCMCVGLVCGHVVGASCCSVSMLSRVIHRHLYQPAVAFPAVPVSSCALSHRTSTRPSMPRPNPVLWMQSCLLSSSWSRAWPSPGSTVLPCHPHPVPRSSTTPYNLALLPFLVSHAYNHAGSSLLLAHPASTPSSDPRASIVIVSRSPRHPLVVLCCMCYGVYGV